MREFNAYGLASLPQRHAAGRPRRLSRDQEEALAVFVRQSSREYGFPWTTWSVAKLREVAVARGVIPPVC